MYPDVCNDHQPLRDKNMTTATATEPKQWALQSTSMVNAPGMLRWAINGYKFKRDRKVMLDVAMKCIIAYSMVRLNGPLTKTTA